MTGAHPPTRDPPTMPSILHRAGLAALLCAACSPTEPGAPVRELGYIESYPSPVEATVPATARAGEPFTVRVVTRGSGCTSAGDTEARVSGAAADVSPYDLRQEGPGIACPDILRSLTHEATLRFDAPGTATVRVHGRREPGGDRLTVTRTVTIQ